MDIRMVRPVAVLAALIAAAAAACGSPPPPEPAPHPAPSPTATSVPVPTATSIPAPAAEQAPAYEPVSVIDGNGEVFEFAEPPGRIVAYSSALVEILFAMGEGHRVLATHDFVTHPPEAESVPRVGGAFEINIEAIVALEPDLVFLFSPSFLEDLRAAGLRVLYIPSRVADFADTAEDMRLWGRIVGNPEGGEALAGDFEARVSALRETLAAVGSGPRVFRDEGGLWTPGPDTLIGEVLELLRLENIAADVSGFEEISPEIVVERDPEVIIATEFSTVDSDPAFADVTAVRQGRIIRLEGDPLSVAGPRFVGGVEDLARAIYPDLFE